MAWVYLFLAGVFEISFTTAMRYSDGFTRLWPTLLVLFLATISIYFVTKAAEIIPLGTAYAAWGGIGAIGTVIIGVLYYEEPVTLWRMVFLATLILSIAGLKLVTE
jgi:quaternary ammonium compound-resistance protein SugE